MFGEKLSHYVDLPRWWIGSPVVEVYATCAPNIVPYMEVHVPSQTRDSRLATCDFPKETYAYYRKPLPLLAPCLAV